MIRLIKRYGIILVSIFFIIVIVLLCLIGLMSINKYKGDVMARDSQIHKLEESLFNIGDVQKGFVVKQTVRAGEKITEEVLEEVDVPIKLGLNLITNKNDIIDKYFRVSLGDGTVLTTDDIVEKKIDNTFRYFDTVIDELPIGLRTGDYVDIRIAFPFGEDFIAISHKRVEELNTGIMKLILSESEIYTYQSMLVDKALYEGTKIYAVEYIDAGSQAVAEVYYPLNKNLSELSSMNPNLLELVKQEMILKRNQIDELMGGGVETKDEKELQRVTTEISRARDNINKSISNSQKELERRLEVERKEAERREAERANQ